jgi:hypothetical protein
MIDAFTEVPAMEKYKVIDLKASHPGAMEWETPEFAVMNICETKSSGGVGLDAGDPIASFGPSPVSDDALS